MKNKPKDRINFNPRLAKKSEKQIKSPKKIVNKKNENQDYAAVLKTGKNNGNRKNGMDQDNTFESHPNMSVFKGQGKKDSRQLSDVDSESEWESICDGPLELAIDPSLKFKKNNNKDKKSEIKEQLNPQRNWEPERQINVNVNPHTSNNLPNQCQGYGGHATSSTSSAGHQNRGLVENQRGKKVTKKSYHISSVGESGEVSLEQQIVNEDGEQVLNNISFKKKINQKRLEELENEEDLLPMRRKIATRFLLTLCDPRMTVGSVEKYFRKHFEVGGNLY